MAVNDPVLTRIAANHAIKISAQVRTTLQPADDGAFFAALDALPLPVERLRTAFTRHRTTMTSR